MSALLSNLGSIGMDVITVLLQIVIFATAYFVIRFLKTKLGTQFAQIFVTSIEQTMKLNAGVEKKQVVATLLKSKLGFLFSVDEIDHLIEAAVFEMNKGIAKPLVSNSQSDSSSQMPENNIMSTIDQQLNSDS